MSDKLVLFRLLCVSILWGCNYVASAYLLHDFSPIFLSFSRLFVTSLFLLSVAAIGGKLKKPTLPEWGLLLCAGVFGTMLNQYFYFTGLQDSTAGNAALIVALSPIATTFLARMFLGEKITFFKLVGAALGLIGVCLIVLFGGKSLGISQGDISILLAMLTLSISLLFVRKLTVTMPSYDVTILSTVVGTVLMSPLVGIEALQGHIHMGHQWYMWLILASAAIFGQGLAGFWWNQGIAVVGASTSSMFMNIPPFVAIVVAFLALGDPIRIAQIAGGFFIIAGVAVSNRKMRLPLPVETSVLKQ